MFLRQQRFGEGAGECTSTLRIRGLKVGNECGPLPGFCISVHSAGVLKVLCFDTDLQVFILKVVRRFIFQAAGPPTGTVNAELGKGSPGKQRASD